MIRQRRCLPRVRPVFDRRGQAKDGGAGTIDIEVLYRRKRKWIGTGIRVQQNEWNKKTAKIRNRPDMLKLNSMITDKVGKFEDLFYQIDRTGREFDWWMIDAMEQGVDSKEVAKNGEESLTKPVSFLSWMKDRNEDRKDRREKTIAHYKGMVRRVEEFTYGKNEGKLESWEDLNRKNVALFDQWLHARGISQVTIYSIEKRLKRYINEAKMMGYIEENPYIYVKVSRGKSTAIRYLDRKQLKAVAEAEIKNQSFSRVRDLFMFQCYSGLAYSDLAQFDFHECREADGMWWYTSRRVKTDERYDILIMDPAMKILEKYDYKLPIISNQQYNIRLKAVENIAGIDVNLTSHVARHTFAVMALSNGVQIEMLAKMMGHSDIKTTQIYAKVLAEDVRNAMSQLNTRLTDGWK